MAKKYSKITEMIQMINYLKREDVDIIDILEILKAKNMMIPKMSELEAQTFLSKFTDIPIEEFFYKNNFLDDFEFLLDYEEDFGYDDKLKNEKRKRYLN